MISLPTGARIWIAAGITDLRRGFTGLSSFVQTWLEIKRIARAECSFFGAWAVTEMIISATRQGARLNRTSHTANFK